MHPVKVDIGGVYGRLTVLGLYYKKYGRKNRVNGVRKLTALCVCECGTRHEVVAYNLVNGGSRSCGCLKKEKCGKGTHRKTHTTEYNSWIGMKTRCNNINSSDYPNYGGRGISVCEEWVSSFERFLSDMGEKPGVGYSLDRIDVDGNYCPSNCRWATQKTQNNNKQRNNRSFITNEYLHLWK